MYNIFIISFHLKVTQNSKNIAYMGLSTTHSVNQNRTSVQNSAPRCRMTSLSNTVPLGSHELIVLRFVQYSWTECESIKSFFMGRVSPGF